MNDNTPAKTKRIVIIVASVILIIITIAIGFNVASQLNQPEPRATMNEPTSNEPNDTQPMPEAPTETPAPPEKISDEDATQTIIKSSPSLVDSTGQPAFRITKSISPEAGWYIVTLENTESNSEGARVILNNKSGTLTVVAGPATFFPTSIDLPDKVRKAIYK